MKNSLCVVNRSNKKGIKMENVTHINDSRAIELNSTQNKCVRGKMK